MNKTELLSEALEYISADQICDALLCEKTKRTFNFGNAAIAAAVTAAVAIPAAVLIAPIFINVNNENADTVSVSETETDAFDPVETDEDEWICSGRYYAPKRFNSQYGIAAYVIDMKTGERIYACGDDNCMHKTYSASCILKDGRFCGSVTNTDRYIFFTAYVNKEKTTSIYKYDMKTKKTEKVTDLTFEMGTGLLECRGNSLYYGRSDNRLIKRYDMITGETENVFYAGDNVGCTFVCLSDETGEVIYMYDGKPEFYITVNGKYDLSKKLEFDDKSACQGIISKYLIRSKYPAKLYDYNSGTTIALPTYKSAKGFAVNGDIVCFAAVSDFSNVPQTAQTDTDGGFFQNDLYVMNENGEFRHFIIKSDFYGYPCAYYDGNIVYEVYCEYYDGIISDENTCKNSFAYVDLKTGKTVLYNDKYDIDKIDDLSETVSHAVSVVEEISGEETGYPQLMSEITTDDPDVVYKIEKYNKTGYRKTLYICGIQTYSVSISGDPDRFNEPSVVYTNEDIKAAKDLIPLIKDEYKKTEEPENIIYDNIYRIFDKVGGEIKLYDIYEIYLETTLIRIKRDLISGEAESETDILRWLNER